MISLFLTSFYAIGSQASSAFETNQTTVKLGGLFPLTGTLSGGGVERDAAARMAVLEINADSGFDFDIDLLVRDTATDPATGSLAAGDVISLGAVGIIGAASSSVSKAIASGPAKTSKVPQISYSSTNPGLSDKTTYPYFLRVVPSDAEQGVAIGNILNDFGWTQIATLASSDDYGLGGIEIVEDTAEKLGIDVLATERFQQGASDVKAQLQAIADSGARIIVLNVIVGDAITVFSQAADVGVTAEDGYVWFGTDGPTQGAVFEGDAAIQEAMQGMIGTRPFTGSGNVFDDFLDTWEACADSDNKEYAGCGDRTPNTYATFAYDAVYTFANAIQKMIDAGTDYADGDLLLAELEKSNFAGATGTIEFNDLGDRVGIYDIVNLQADAFVVVGGYDAINGRSLTDTIYWDGDASGRKTGIPADSRGLPGFGFYAAFFTLILAVPILRRRRN